MNCGFRKATPRDISLLRHWGEQPHVLTSDPNSDWEWEAELLVDADWREQLIYEIDGRPVGFVQIMDPAGDPDRYWGEVKENLRAIDIWIGLASDLGQGHGSEMMRLALERCFADPEVAAVLIDPLASNTRAHRFYRKHGFEFVEERWFGPDHCFVFRKGRPQSG